MEHRNFVTPKIKRALNGALLGVLGFAGVLGSIWFDAFSLCPECTQGPNALYAKSRKRLLD